MHESYQTHHQHSPCVRCYFLTVQCLRIFRLCSRMFRCSHRSSVCLIARDLLWRLPLHMQSIFVSFLCGAQTIEIVFMLSNIWLRRSQSYCSKISHYFLLLYLSINLLMHEVAKIRPSSTRLLVVWMACKLQANYQQCNIFHAPSECDSTIEAYVYHKFNAWRN